MHTRIACFSLLVFAGALVLPGPVKATSIPITNPDQLGANATLLTFAGVQPFQNVTSYEGVGFQYVGQALGNGLQGAFDANYVREFGPQEGTFLNQFEFGTQGVQITLPSESKGLGFELRTYPNETGNLSISLYDSGNLIDSFTFLNRGTTDPLASEFLFYGFESTIPFDSLVLVGPGDGRFGLDNLYLENAVTAVPEPSTLSLLSLCTFSLLGYRWRRRRIAASACG